MSEVYTKDERKEDTYTLGPVPGVKFPKLLPERGHGVIPESVFPYPGSSVQVIPATLVLRVVCAASIDTPPSPSTKPLNPAGGVFFVATKKTCSLIEGWPGTVALKVITAFWVPVTLLQSTVASTRTSGLLGDTEPVEGVKISHDSFAVALKVNGDGPPAPTSTNRLLKGTKLSNVATKGGQFNIAAHWLGLSPGLIINELMGSQAENHNAACHVPAVPSGEMRIAPGSACFFS